MKHKGTGTMRMQNWHWIYPVLLLAVLVGLIAPTILYVKNYTLFSVKYWAMLPAMLLCFAAVLAVGVGIGLLIVYWPRIKDKLADYMYVVFGVLLALSLLFIVQKKYPNLVISAIGIVLVLMARSWQRKYKYLFFGIALVVGIVVFIQNKYPLLTVFVWGAILGMVLDKRIRPINVYTDIIFGLALAICAQLLFCNGGLETLASTQPKWDNKSAGAVLSLHLWGLCLILPSALRLVIGARMQRRVKRWGSAVLTVVAIIAVMVLLVKTDLSPIRVVTKGDEFVLSEDENVVVFLVDSLDARYAEDYVLAEDMRLEDGKEKEKTGLDESLSHALLDDFTYFDNVVSGAWHNTVSIPTLLTGVRFDVNPEQASNYNWEMYSKDRDRYYEEAYSQSTLFGDLIENGYSVRFYSNSNLVKGMDVGQIDNIRTDISFQQRSFGTSLKNMFQLAAYYAMPYQAKPTFWLSSNDISNNTEIATPDVQRYSVWDASFYKDYVNEGLSLTENGKAFVIYHLRGALVPYRMNEECKEVKEADTSLGQQVTGVFRMIYEYVEEMKARGVYDNSTIIIAGTNGDRELGQNPAVFIKRKHDAGPFVRNSQPLTFANLRASLVDGIVENPLPVYGYNMFNQPEDAAPVLREHLVEKSKWQEMYSDNGSRWRTFMIMDEAAGKKNILKTVESDPYACTLDEWIPLCGYDDMTDVIHITGLGTNEKAYRWTVGQDVTMGFALEEPRENVLFRMDYSGTINDAQRVMAFVNNHPVYDEIASGASSIQFIIPMEYAPDGIYNIVLKLPDAMAPKELGINNDGRLLGLQVTGCILSADLDDYYYPCELNRWVSLCGDDMVESLPATGLSGNEGEYRWTLGNRVWMSLKLDGTSRDVRFELDCKGTFNGSQQVQIFANDHLVFDDTVTERSTIECVVPKAFAPRGLYDVVIILPDAISPAEIGLSEDTRKLALQLTGFRLSAAHGN